MSPTDAPTALTQPTLATDLDGTFALGPADVRSRVVADLAAAPDGCLVYVTGRSVAAWRALASECDLPTPAIAITDVGTTVVDGETLAPIAAIERDLAPNWPGHDAIRERLARVGGLDEQAVDAPRRLSYTFAPGADQDAVTRAAASRLADLAVDVLPSAGLYLDILPRGVNKGTTLLRTLAQFGRATEATIVAGDSLNDLALFATGLRGVVVANAEPALKTRLAGRLNVHFARHPGVEGIAEGLAQFGVAAA